MYCVSLSSNTLPTRQIIMYVDLFNKLDEATWPRTKGVVAVSQCAYTHSIEFNKIIFQSSEYAPYNV